MRVSEVWFLKQIDVYSIYEIKNVKKKKKSRQFEIDVYFELHIIWRVKENIYTKKCHFQTERLTSGNNNIT